MPRTALTTLLLLISASGYCQQASDSLFQQAETFELQQEFRSACLIYDTLIQRGYRVDEIRSKRIYRIYREIEDRYSSEVAAGDKAFAASQFVEARAAYQRATALHPEAAHPKEQIQRIEEALSKQKR